MEFKSLKNIETSFRQIRLFGIVYTAACALVVVCSVVCAFRFAEAPVAEPSGGSEGTRAPFP